MNSFLLPRRVNVCRSRISVVFWSDRFLPPTARIAEVFAVTLVFFSTACQQKGALPACLASRGFPHYLFEHIAVSAQTCNNAPFANGALLLYFYLGVVSLREMSHRTNVYQRITRLAKHIRGTERVHGRHVATLYMNAKTFLLFTSFSQFCSPTCSVNCLQNCKLMSLIYL